jgi:hypothetical protein
MPELNQLAVPLVMTLGAVFIVWFLAGNELMRRRGRSLALWCKRSLDPLGGKQAIQWITLHSFRLEVEDLKAPFQSGKLTGLVESLDVPIIWLVNRINGRRDMVLLQLVLRQQPIWGLEVFRTKSVLAGDARQLAREEGWGEEPFEEFRLASVAGDTPRKFARELLSVLGDQRPNLLRLAIRRRGLHLTLALNVPDHNGFSPGQFSNLIGRLANATRRFATPAPSAE